MSNRKEFTGRLCVYRDGPLLVKRCQLRLKLMAAIRLLTTPAPQAFNNIIADPLKNTQHISFTAGKYGDNPRGVKLPETQQ